MKKLYFFLLFLTVGFIANAQQEEQLPEKKQQDIEALKVAFISKELDLTPEDAQKFWPVYNQYSKELKAAVRSNDQDIIERDEKVLNLRKSYKEKFERVLGQQRMNRMYGAEGRFRQLLIKAIRRQNNMQQDRPNRPMMRRGGGSNNQ